MDSCYGEDSKIQVVHESGSGDECFVASHKDYPSLQAHGYSEIDAIAELATILGYCLLMDDGVEI